MAWSMKTEGLTELSEMLGQLADQAEKVASGALFDGAGIVADAFNSAVNSIQTERFTHKKNHRLPSPEEKASLQGKTGIAKFRKNGSEVDTIIGFTRDAGYTQLGNRKTAVIAIARSINSGTSFMTKQPVFRKAARSASSAAKAAMIAKADQMIEEITGK